MMRQYVVTEAELLALIDSLASQKMIQQNVMREGWKDDPNGKRPEDLHRAFHYVVVRWVQDIGFSGLRQNERRFVVDPETGVSQ